MLPPLRWCLKNDTSKNFPFLPLCMGKARRIFWQQFLTTPSFATNLLAMGKRKQRHNPKHGNWVLSFVGALNPEKQTKIQPKKLPTLTHKIRRIVFLSNECNQQNVYPQNRAKTLPYDCFCVVRPATETLLYGWEGNLPQLDCFTEGNLEVKFPTIWTD